ncbi:MAG: CPBP family intramembrane metalloprotease [Polyangiaceae bacterium]|nr:CPBP family intramembrane metalloprotease [Polyangiaceae bacterium]
MLSLAGSEVGSAPRGRRAWLVGAVALAALGLDLVLHAEPWHLRLLPAVASFALTASLVRDRRALGLGLAPRPGLRYWLAGTLVIGGVVAAALALVALAVLLASGPEGLRLPPHVTPAWLRSRLGLSLVEAPLFEEAIYRLAPCAALVASLGRPAAVAVSGGTFAALHFLYGNPSADNFVAGFLFAWAFLRSETLLVPVALHALGNACAVLLTWLAWLAGLGS